MDPRTKYVRLFHLPWLENANCFTLADLPIRRVRHDPVFRIHAALPSAQHLPDVRAGGETRVQQDDARLVRRRPG